MRWIVAGGTLVAAVGGDCPIPEELPGAYRLEDGRLVSVRESAPETIRLRESNE